MLQQFLAVHVHLIWSRKYKKLLYLVAVKNQNDLIKTEFLKVDSDLISCQIDVCSNMKNLF